MTEALQTCRPVEGPLEPSVGRHGAPQYRGWLLLEKMPQGWRLDSSVGSPLAGHAFVTDGKSVLRGGKRALLRVLQPQAQLRFEEPIQASGNEAAPHAPSAPAAFVFDASQARTVNELARQKFKHRLLADIVVDLTICEIEGWCKREYINELRGLLNGIGRDVVTPNGSNERGPTA